MGQGRDEGSAGDEFDEIRARVDRIRREAQQRIEALRDPTALDVRLPPRPGSRPPARPAPAAPRVPPADPVPPALTERPAPPEVSAVPPADPAPSSATPPPAGRDPSRDWRDSGRPATTPAPLRSEPSAPEPTAPAPRSEEPPARDEPTGHPSPVEVPATDAPAEEAEPVRAGRTIPVEDLPPPGPGWDAPLRDAEVEDRAAASDGRGGAPWTFGLREGIERIAATRSITVLLWQVASVVLLVAALVWAVWFPLAAGSGSRALVVADDRMAPTVNRGDVVIVAPSVDLPYPLDAVVAFDVDGALIVERVVEEVVTEDVRLLVTRADGVSVGPSRQVDPAQVEGSVRRVHRVVGYPALWFSEPGSIVWRIALILLLVSSAVGTASLVVRAELRRQDRLLVSAIASGDRTPRRR